MGYYVSVKRGKYANLQQSYREGKRVRTRHVAYLGVVGGKNFVSIFNAHTLDYLTRPDEELFGSEGKYVPPVGRQPNSMIPALMIQAVSPEECFLHESGLSPDYGRESAATSDGAGSNGPSSSEGQPSDSGDAT